MLARSQRLDQQKVTYHSENECHSDVGHWHEQWHDHVHVLLSLLQLEKKVQYDANAGVVECPFTRLKTKLVFEKRFN